MERTLRVLLCTTYAWYLYFRPIAKLFYPKKKGFDLNLSINTIQTKRLSNRELNVCLGHNDEHLMRPSILNPYDRFNFLDNTYMVFLLHI